jgi:hypothetical protein
VTDIYDNTIRKIIINSGIAGEVYSGEVTTIAGTPPVVTKNDLLVTTGSKDGIGSVATFNKPIGITTDGINLFIVDNQNHRIRKVQ